MLLQKWPRIDVNQFYYLCPLLLLLVSSLLLLLLSVSVWKPLSIVLSTIPQDNIHLLCSLAISLYFRPIKLTIILLL